MNIYDFAKEILVPLLAPTVAASSLIITFRLDRRRIRREHENQIENAARAIYRDALSLRHQYAKLVMSWHDRKEIAPERYDLIESTGERIIKNLYDNPFVYERYFQGFQFKVPQDKPNKEGILSLLGEMEIGLKSMRRVKEPNNIFIFGYELLIYAGANNKETRDKAERYLLGFIKDNPEYLRSLFSDR